MSPRDYMLPSHWISAYFTEHGDHWKELRPSVLGALRGESCDYCGRRQPSLSRMTCANCGAPRSTEVRDAELAARRAASDRFVIQ